MRSQYLPILTILVPFSRANPIARVQLIPRQFTNTSITQTSTDTTTAAEVLTTATCTATYTAAPEARCSDVASSNSIQLSSFEANSAANSTDCQDILLGYALCLSNASVADTTTSTAPFLNTTLSGNAGTAGTAGSIALNTAAPNTAALNTAVSVTGLGTGTGSAASASTLAQSRASPAVTSFMYIIEEIVSETTLTSFDTSTLTYTIGTGTSKAVRTTEVTHTNEDVRTVTALSTISTITALADVTETVSPSSSSEAATTSSSTALADTTTSSTSSDAVEPISSSAASSSSTSLEEATTSSTASETVDATSSSAVSSSSSIPAKAAATSESTTLTSSSSELLTSTSSSVLTSSSATLTSSSALANSVAATSSSATPSPTTSSSVDVYKAYTGNGSVAAGWPSEDQWVTFDHMFASNTPHIQESCDAWGVARNSDAETAEMKDAILSTANTTGVDARFILATVMQESTGCVRVITTQYSHFNPGLMQSHNGTGTCNTNQAALNIPGTNALASNVQDPCPASEIRQQITDGTAGTSSGDGLQQILAQQTQTDATRYYRAARVYNGGSVDPSGDLGKGCCTLCYASDIANRLTGWVSAKSTCTL